MVQLRQCAVALAASLVYSTSAGENPSQSNEQAAENRPRSLYYADDNDKPTNPTKANDDYLNGDYYRDYYNDDKSVYDVDDDKWPNSIGKKDKCYIPKKDNGNWARAPKPYYAKGGKTKGAGGKGGKTKGGYGYPGYTGTYNLVGNGFCEQGSSFPFPLLYEGLIFKYETPSFDRCESTCSGVGGPGFRGFNYIEGFDYVDCVCYFDDGHVPDCPRNNFVSHSGWSSKPASPAFVCAKSELGIAVGPITDVDTTFSIKGITATCYSAENSYWGKSGKTKGSGYSGYPGYHGKSGKGYYKSSLSFVDEDFCRDSDGDNYDAVWFVLAGILESPDDGKELLGLCEAKCKSPPSFNPDIEHFAATGLVGVNYLTIYDEPLSSMTAGDNMDILSESVSESISLTLADELGESSISSKYITKAVEEQLEVFVDAMATEGGRRLTFGGLDLVVSACFCDYTDKAISCDDTEDNGVFTISGGDLSSSPFTTVDLNLSGEMPYLSVSAACFDDINGQGHVAGTGGPSFLGFDCYRNNDYYDGYGRFDDPVYWKRDPKWETDYDDWKRDTPKYEPSYDDWSPSAYVDDWDSWGGGDPHAKLVGYYGSPSKSGKTKHSGKTMGSAGVLSDSKGGKTKGRALSDIDDGWHDDRPVWSDDGGCYCPRWGKSGKTKGDKTKGGSYYDNYRPFGASKGGKTKQRMLENKGGRKLGCNCDGWYSSTDDDGWHSPKYHDDKWRVTDDGWHSSTSPAPTICDDIPPPIPKRCEDDRYWYRSESNGNTCTNGDDSDDAKAVYDSLVGCCHNEFRTMDFGECEYHSEDVCCEERVFWWNEGAGMCTNDYQGDEPPIWARTYGSLYMCCLQNQEWPDCNHEDICEPPAIETPEPTLFPTTMPTDEIETPEPTLFPTTEMPTTASPTTCEQRKWYSRGGFNQAKTCTNGYDSNESDDLYGSLTACCRGEFPNVSASFCKSFAEDVCIEPVITPSPTPNPTPKPTKQPTKPPTPSPTTCEERVWYHTSNNICTNFGNPPTSTPSYSSKRKCCMANTETDTYEEIQVGGLGGAYFPKPSTCVYYDFCIPFIPNPPTGSPTFGSTPTVSKEATAPPTLTSIRQYVELSEGGSNDLAFQTLHKYTTTECVENNSQAWSPGEQSMVRVCVYVCTSTTTIKDGDGNIVSVDERTSNDDCPERAE